MSRDLSLVAINNHSPIFSLNTLRSVCVKYLLLCYSSVWLGASTSRTIYPERVKYCKTTTYFLDIPIFVLSLRYFENRNVSKRKLQAQQECVKARDTGHRARGITKSLSEDAKRKNTMGWP